MRGTHGWAEIDAARKSEIIEAIRSGRATRGPSHVELDITDRCNVACYFCNQQDVRTKQQISFQHLSALIDQLAQIGVRSVRMSGGGDPLAHRDAGGVLDHLHARGIVVDNLTTNGALLNPAIARRLVDHRAREVIFSLNAGNAADYQRMMQVRPETFDRVTGNIAHLVEARGGNGCPAVVAQFLIDRKNYQDLPQMYELGLSLGADRIALGLVLNIPGQHFDPDLLLEAGDGERLRPHLEEILRRDRERQLLQISFPVQEWNAMVEEIKRQIDGPPETPLFATAPSFQDRNGHCFFGWYTATIRGNGDLYPCCLLMFPDYKPMGNALNGRFVDHWNGPVFEKLRQEQRDVLLAGDEATFDPARFQVLRKQCVEHGLCWLKNVYFRGDEAFYKDLAEALEQARRHPGWKSRWRRLSQGALSGFRAGTGRLRAALRHPSSPSAP